MKFKRNSLIFISILCIIAIILLLNFESIETFHSLKTASDTINVTISIDCSSILPNYDKLDKSLQNTAYVPTDGIILNMQNIQVKQGASVLDALIDATTKNLIQLEYSQAPNDSYVEGINHIYEFSCGELSGWMYKINGEFASVGCNSCILKENDIIEWVYTCNLGKDVGEEFE